MKHVVHRWVVCLLPIFFVLTSCADTPEKLRRDFENEMYKDTLVLGRLEKDEITSQQALEEINQISNKRRFLMKRLMHRISALAKHGGYSEKQIAEYLIQAYHRSEQEDTEEAFKIEESHRIIDSLKASGKLTPELRAALGWGEKDMDIPSVPTVFE